jgi:hypothetical protein
MTKEQAVQMLTMLGYIRNALLVIIIILGVLAGIQIIKGITS